MSIMCSWFGIGCRPADAPSPTDQVVIQLEQIAERIGEGTAVLHQIHRDQESGNYIRDMTLGIRTERPTINRRRRERPE